MTQRQACEKLCPELWNGQLLMSRPLVSVVLPFRNAEKYLASAIDSILAQDYPALELVLVDDGSTDESPQLAAAYGCDAVKIIRQAYGGVGEAFARGLGKAEGRIIACASADDISHADRISRSVECFERERAHVVSCRPDIIDHASSACEKSFFSAFERDVRPADGAAFFASLFYDGNFVCAPAAAFDRDAMDQIEVHSGLMQLQDFDCWIRAAAAGLRFHIESTPWLDYRWHGENLSRLENMKRCQRETVVVYRNLRDRLDVDMLRHLVCARPPSFVSSPALAAAPEFVLRPLVYITHDREDIKQIGYELLMDILRDRSLTAAFEAATALSRHDIFELLRR